jgi:hypothetical protein
MSPPPDKVLPPPQNLCIIKIFRDLFLLSTFMPFSGWILLPSGVFFVSPLFFSVGYAKSGVGKSLLRPEIRHSILLIFA